MRGLSINSIYDSINPKDPTKNELHMKNRKQKTLRGFFLQN